MTRRRTLPLLTLAALGTGCVQILGIGGDFSQGTGGGGAAASSASASASSNASASASAGTGGVATRDVHGIENITHIVAGATVVQPDLTNAKITVLAGPAFETITGQGASNGTFVIKGVPVGEYYLGYHDPGDPPSAPEFFLTSADTLDMSQVVPGRSMVGAISASTMVTVSLAGLVMWQSTNDITALSPGAGIQPFSLLDATGVTPSTGATTFNGKFDAAKAFTPPNLVDSGKNDNFYILQYASVTQGTYPCTILAASAIVSDLVMTSGVAATVPTSAPPLVLKPTPQLLTAQLNLKLTAFEALQGSVHPASKVTEHFFEVAAHLGPESDGPTPLRSGLLVAHPPLGADVTGVPLKFGNPFLNNFYVAEVLATHFNVPLLAPGATSTTDLVAFVEVLADQATFESQPLVPGVLPPANVKVDGTDGSQGGTMLSTTPTITFDAPAGMPARYTVSAFQLTAAPNGSTKINLAGSVHAKGTSIQLPPGIVTGSKTGFAFVVEAVAYPGATIDAEATPRKTTVPFALADAVTSVFTTK